ncbi:MAG: nucleotide pyrophosphohydrolase [Spiribacter salinus]|uniref:Nucleotide pyrophosphohydrolase n=1 Tax=Spiribacter salinus TaxID=1335746 RepID=A0A540VNB6_9GAMM|nr:MAG: nucleotide pyrophosphohydrolase [Spiribacter salinus]
MTDWHPTVEALQQRLAAFVAERDWEQFHSPKNLTMGLCSEAGELSDHFRWLSEAQSRELDTAQHDAVRRELADIQIYLLLLADKLDIDLLQATADKIEENAAKYPAEQVRGHARKYTEL